MMNQVGSEFLQPLRSLNPTTRYVVNLCVVFLAYLIAAVLGLFLYHIAPISPAIIWPPAGIALAAVILSGYRIWPALFLAALVFNFSRDATPIFGIVVAAANTIQPLVGRYLLGSLKFNPMLGTPRDTGALVAVSLTISSIVPLAGTLTEIALHQQGGHTPLEIFEPWWLGTLLSLLVITPFIIRWLRKPTVRTRNQLIEWAASFSLLLFFNYVIFWTPRTEFGGIPIVYFLLIPLFWIALRLGPRAMTLGLFLTSTFALSGTLIPGTGELATLAARIIQMEIFLVILSLIFLVLVSIEEARKEATILLTQHVARLEQALGKISTEDQAKSEFLAILAHELRNPLASILTSIEVLQTKVSPAESSGSLLSTIEDYVRIMARLLDDLLDVSRISQNKFELRREIVDAHSIVERSIEMGMPLMRKHKHTLSTSLSHEPLLIEGDPVRLEQIIVNLLTNAAKYTPDGGLITISCKRERGEGVISVHDNGIGIAPDMLTRIFEPFIQVKQHVRQPAGLGIGLAVTQKLVELHGGTIEAQSAGIGKGSEFILRLPLAEPSLGITAEPKISVSQWSIFQSQKQDSYRILIIDDNQLAAQGLSKLLSLRGHSVEVAYTGSAGLYAAEEFDPDIILLDIGLPDTTGYAVAKHLRMEMKSHACIIALSGYGQKEDRDKAFESGCNEHATKPISLIELEAIFARLPIHASV